MIVHAVQLEQFRNYHALNVSFCDGINVIWGDNAQGKTNLLESIAYLSACRSHRAQYDSDLIQLGAPSATIQAQLTSRNRDFLLKATLTRGQRRKLSSNGVKLKNAAELSGILNTVLFCPEDLDLIRAGALERRRFLDTAICQLRPRYAAALAEYRRLYEQKRCILRDWQEKPYLLDMLEDFNLRMCQTGALLVHYRGYFIEKLKEYAPKIQSDFSSGKETLSLSYQTVKTVADPLHGKQEIFDQLMTHMTTHRQAELDSKRCLSGPHKDDFLVSINGLPTKQFGSQGQTRTAALSLELAEREIFYENDGEYPVLLLDDVLSELDERRQTFVLNRIQGGQVFITCCDKERLRLLDAGQVIQIENGGLSSGQM